MAGMNLYQAFKILRESGLVLEKKLRSEMTPEELADARAKSKERRLLRKARKEGEKKVLDQLGLTHDDLKRQEQDKSASDKSPSNKGDWAVCTFTPIPENFNKHKPEGWGDDVLKKIVQGHDLLVGYYPSKAIAEKIAMTIFAKELDTYYKRAKENDSSYGLEYKVRSVLVVNHSDTNKRWSSARRGPGDSGYWYDAERDVSEKQSKLRNETLEKFQKEQKEEEERREHDRAWANSSWNPNSGRFRNVYAHH